MTYTVQDTTMTALGDAVRKHTGNYIFIDEAPKPFFSVDLEITPQDIANWEWLNSLQQSKQLIIEIPYQELLDNELLGYTDLLKYDYIYRRQSGDNFFNPQLEVYLNIGSSIGSGNKLSNQSNNETIYSKQSIAISSKENKWKISLSYLNNNITYYPNTNYYIHFDFYCIHQLENGETKYISKNGYTPAEMAEFINNIELQDITITENGTYTADENYFGINEVNVNVEPKLQDITITENGTYTSTDYDGYDEVKVNIPLESITITSNGTYKADKGGYNEIIATITPSLPDEAKIITGTCNYRFANGGWDWFINAYGDQLETYNITGATYMFSEASKINYIPFDINVGNYATINNMFVNCKSLKEVPYVIGPERTPPTSAYSGTVNLEYLFQGCNNLKEIPYDWFWKFIPNKEYWDAHQGYDNGARGSIFWNCYSLREIPDISMLPTTITYGTLYNYAFTSCYVLNKIINLPVVGAKLTSNQMSDTFKQCCRINEITFATNEDGTPKTANWKSQTLELSVFTGYANVVREITDYNSGITVDKQVTDDATYQALKNDPDWFTTNIDYSRYNHDSAVNTINSLPDTSAYGTNTIKFKGQSGAKTDGGAINTLTEAEIAVATAKGWTVSLV